MYRNFAKAIARSFCIKQVIKKRLNCQKNRTTATKLKLRIKRSKISDKPDRHYGNAEPLDGIRSIDDTEFVKDMDIFVK